MKKYLLTSFVILTALLSFSQDNFKKNDIYLEAGGNGLFGSLNYERQLSSHPGFGARIGLGFYAENAFYLTIPAGINYLFKLKNERSFIDAGLGSSWTYTDGAIIFGGKYFTSNNFVNFIPSIGYRRHTAKDVMWRISLTPVINRYGLVPWLGVSLGKRF